MAEQLGVPIQSGAGEELTGLSATLHNRGPFLTFVQSDAAPDNCLWHGEHLRLIDFEGARYTHALLEGVYCRMPFPTCWCVYRMPEAIMQRAEAAYRAELAQACPAAADHTLFSPRVTLPSTYWPPTSPHSIRPP